MAVNQANVVSTAAVIATGAYTQLVAATPITCTTMIIANTTTQVVKLAYGASGFETDLVAVAPGASVKVDIGLNVVPKGTRLALEAIGSATASGLVAVSLIP